jgi:outer membrane lipoprotein carrier protein
MSFLLSIIVAFLLPVQGSDLNALITGVDLSFARMNDLSSDFVQISQDTLNRKQEESGHLYMKKPGMMRWEYRKPEEKLFISDGKNIFFYVPADRQVTREPVSQAIDDRIPLMFVLGRSNLRNEFTRFELLSEKPFLPGDKLIRMYPKRKTDLSEVVIEVDPVGYAIRRLIFAHTNGERSEFIFSNIQTNSGLKKQQFQFTAPVGVEVLNGIGR